MARIDAAKWWDRIQFDRKIAFEEDQRRVEQWDQALELYRYGTKRFSAASSRLRVNVVQGVIDNIVSFLMPPEIRAAVYPVANGQEERAERVQGLLNNHVIPDGRLTEHAEAALQEANIFSDSFLKIGYIASARRSVADEQSVEALLSTAPGPPEQRGGDFGEQASQEFQGESLWFTVVKPWNLWAAAGSTRLEDSPYVIHKIRKRLEDVQDSPQYPNGNDLRPSTDDEFERRVSRMKQENPEVDYVDLYEIWNLRDQWFGVLAHGHTKVWAREPGDWPFPGLQEYPFAHLGFQRDPRGLYRIPLLSHIADLQEELNDVSTFMLETFKRSVPVTAYDKNRVDAKQAERLASAEIEEMVEVDGDVSQAFTRFPQGNTFSPDLYGIRNMVIQAMLLVTGQADFVIGQSQRTKSATEAGLQAQSLRGRMQRREATFHRFLADVLRKSYRILRSRMTTERWIRMTGIGGARAVIVRPEDLARDDLQVDVDVEPGEDRDRDPVRLRIVTDAMSLLIQSPEVAALAGVDLIELFRRYFKAIGVRNLDRLQPVGARPESPEDENAAMAQGHRVEVHPLDDDPAHIQRHLIAQNAADEQVQRIFQEHIQKHQQQLLLKVRSQGQAAGNGASGIIQERGATGAPGGEQARTQQAGANR